jgi:hypothetical protein
VCECFKGEEPERQATLHAAYLRKYPECYSQCCRRLHCFRCQIQQFHNQLTCEQYQAESNVFEDVIPCPQCGIQLTKGDGCSSVSCVCGKNFQYDEARNEMYKLFADAFEKKYHGEVAQAAARLLYKGGTSKSLHSLAPSVFEEGLFPRRRRSAAAAAAGDGLVNAAEMSDHVKAVAWSRLSTSASLLLIARADLFEFMMVISTCTYILQLLLQCRCSFFTFVYVKY